MIVARLNMPVNDNKGVELNSIHARLKMELVTEFLGCTITKGQGVWANDGVIYDEPVLIYEVAFFNQKIMHKYMLDKFIEIAHKYGAEASQLAVYYTIDGKAFVDDVKPPFAVQSRPSPAKP